MVVQEVMELFESLGTEQAIKIYRRHGCDIETFGVSIANLNKIYKRIKKDTDLGYELFLSNNADAIYLSQWLVDIHKLTIEEIEQQILASNYYLLIEYVIPHIVIQDLDKTQLCLQRWLNHSEPRFRQAAYSLYSILVSIQDDSSLDIKFLSMQLDYIQLHIHQESNRVRYTMNNFVISIGAYVKELNAQAKEVAKAIGKVTVDMGETSCRVPLALKYIQKVEQMNRIGQKRKL